MNFSTGTIVPSALETCASASNLVRGPISVVERRKVDFAGLRDRDDLERGARLLAQQLPRHDVRVMLERGDQDLIAGRKLRTRKALRNEIDAFGRAANEYDFLRVARIDEAPDVFACAFVGVGRALTQRMHAAMHVGVIALVVAGDRVDDRARTLARRGIVEIDERLAVDLLRKDRKVAPNRSDVEALSGARGADVLRSWRDSC